MSNALLAKILGLGVEAAALTPHAKWRELLLDNESLSADFDGENGSIAIYKLLPIQELDHFGKHVIEVHVLATDGHRQLSAYFYARPCGAEPAS